MQQIYLVAKESDHLKAFASTAAQMMAGFSLIPYVARYMTSNVGMPKSFIALMYLCSGTATLFSMRFIGRMADKYGRPRIFRWLALAALIPVLTTGHLEPVPWRVALPSATAFFCWCRGAWFRPCSAPQPHNRHEEHS